MRKIVFGFIAFSSSVIATVAVAEPRLTTAPTVSPMIQQAQGGPPPPPPGVGPPPPPPGGPAWGCDSVQQMCTNQWGMGGFWFNRCMWLRGC